MTLMTMAAATAEDSARDPTRWGSAEVAAHFPGFEHVDVRTRGAVIRLRHGGKIGSGPPLLLVHGNPQNHACWYKIAARLAQHYHVILPDLRGYGDSSLPEPGADHMNYSFRSMAEYIRCYTLKTITGSCRDYRATATCDFVMDTADKDKKLAMPLMLLWGARGHSPERAAEFLTIWRQYASNIVATDAMNCGHYMQEEMPDRMVEHFSRFFV